jgi:methylmalonyl-CoA mutase cobalamin-binding subunit
MEKLAKMGVGNLFGPATNTKNIVKYIKDWYSENRQS